MAKIVAPNKEYTGLSASVYFCKGEGQTDKPELIEWFKEHGYEVEEDTVPNKKDNPISLEELKKDELKELAVNLGIEFSSKATNDELINLIKNKQAEDKSE